MDRIDAMRAFVEAVRAGGFAAAARILDLPRSAVSKRVQSLEGSLGVQLLMRTTRSLHLTDAGAAFFEDAQEVLAALDDAEERARGSASGLRGSIRCNVPISFGTRVLAPLVPAFLARHPGVDLQLALTDQLVDPVRGGFDLTIRIADLRDSSLSARRIAAAPRRLVAAPSFVARHGVPDAPEALASLPCLNYGHQQGGVTLALQRGGEARRVRMLGPVTADNGDLLASLAEAGLGVALLPEFIVGDAIRDGRLVVLLGGWQPPPIAIYALFPQARGLPMRVRGLVDFLVERVGAEPHLGAPR